MDREHTGIDVSAADRLAARLVAGLPVDGRRLDLAGVSTSVLEGGTGPPIVLLHGEGGFAEMLGGLIASLVGRFHVVAPDLPGLGRSALGSGPLRPAGVMRWLGDLIATTCAEPPIVVGVSLGGSIAIRFAVERGSELRRLVLVSSGSLGRFQPSPSLLVALRRFVRKPDRRRADRLYGHLFHDLDRVRNDLGGRLTAIQDYMIERAGHPSVRAADRGLRQQIGTKRVAAAELRGITAPVRMIWGRHDRVCPLTHAQRASASFGWPLHVIDGAGHIPYVEQPAAFDFALRAVLDLMTQPTHQQENP